MHYEPIPDFQLVPPTQDRPNNEYQTYLQSPRWQRIRRAVKLRASSAHQGNRGTAGTATAGPSAAR